MRRRTLNPRSSLALAVALSLAGSTHAGNGPDRSEKTVEVRSTETAPRIDGMVEATWTQADTATGFIQSQPYEKTEPTERTEVYLLQDKDNLYVAFRCHSLGQPPVANFTKDEDYVSIGFDPFGSRSSGYFFQVFGSGLFWDGLVLDDGRVFDQTWEGVWSRAVRIYSDRMEVEMKIPWKTIRYKKGLSEWAVQFRRHMAANVEDNYWTEVTQKDGDLVSRWGTARGVNPQSTGYYFELYPEVFLRYDDYRGEESEARPKASLNLKWDLTSQTSLNATVYPDFAQIESDPFSVNLSRYPTYLEEQRPFFVEGREIFRFSSFPNSGFFQPINIFYSRRIGKSVDGETVPIIGGMKVTHKTETWNAGALGALTESYRDDEEGIKEPQRAFGVVRATRRCFSNSSVGLLGSGVSAGAGDYNYALGADAVLRRGPNQMILQAGMSDRDGKRGAAASAGYRGYLRNLLTMGTVEAVSDSFDVADIGYVPWTGRQRILLISGPFWTFPGGAMRNLYVAPGIVRSREPGSPHWATLGYFTVNPNLRSHWGCNIEGSYGKNYEYDVVTNSFVGYTSRSLDFSFWGIVRGNNMNGGCSYSYGYNYQRAYLAYQGTNWLTFSYSFAPPVSTTLESNLWVEWDPENEVVAMWPRFRPRIDCRITAYMTLSVFNEMVAYTPEDLVSKTRLQADRLGMLYSWNFAPKSWLLFAVNDYNALDDLEEHPAGVMKQQYVIGAFKVKYLIYF